MNVPKLAFRAALGIVVIAGCLIVLDSKGSQYSVQLRLTNALGLRNGSKVVEGGVQVGTVDVRLGSGDQVLASLHIDRRYAPLGRNATGQITALNLLGEKSLQLNPGNRSDPAPSGYVLPAGSVTPGTDLDQVLDVLDPATADRLTILVNEAGEAVAGRRSDIGTILSELPGTIPQGTELLGQLASNNNQLSSLVSETDGVISGLDSRRNQLGDLIDTFGQSAKTVETRDADLQSSLRELPGTLVTARTFLAKLQSTTQPLGPAARDITSVAPGLQSVLNQISPFTQAATPTLAKATSVAPELTDLAARATPVLRAAEPTLASLTTASTNLKPVSAALDKSVDNIIAVMWNWTHAIELRDQLSHVFRAEIGVSATTINEVVNRLLAFQHKTDTATGDAQPAKSTAAPKASLGSVLKSATGAASNVTGTVGGVVGQAGNSVSGAVNGLSGTASEVTGGLSSAVHGLTHGGSHGSQTSTTSTSTASTAQLSALLKYLF